MKIINQIDEDWFVSYQKESKFIEESDIRVDSVKNFYKEKGIFFYAVKKEDLSRLCPYFIINYSSAEHFNSLAGIRVYPSVGGFFLKTKEEIDNEKLKKILKKPEISPEEDSSIDIREIDVDDEVLTAKIIYKYSRNKKLFFPTNPVFVKIKILKTERKNIFAVLADVRRYNDFKNVRAFFNLNCFNSQFNIIDVNYSKVEDSKVFHDLIKSVIDEIKDIKTKINSSIEKFQIRGSFKHNAVRTEDLEPGVEIAYFKDSEKFSTETDLTPPKELISELEEKAGKRINRVNIVYFSKKIKLYFIVTFDLKSYFFITFNSSYTKTNNKQVVTKEDLYNNLRKILNEDNIKMILEKLWLKSSLKFLSHFNK